MTQKATSIAPRGASSRREEILTAAARMFAEHGYRGVGMDDLGGAVGVTGPALYRHFGGKDDVLATLLVGVSTRLLAGGRERAENSSSSALLLADLVDWQVEFALKNPELIIVHERDLDHLPATQRRTVRHLQRTYVEIWVGALRDSVHVDELRARTAVHATIGLINSTPRIIRTQAGVDVRALLTRMALAALRACG